MADYFAALASFQILMLIKRSQFFYIVVKLLAKFSDTFEQFMDCLSHTDKIPVFSIKGILDNI
jgi:hypothetical protein